MAAADLGAEVNLAGGGWPEVHAGLAEQPFRLADAAGQRAVGVG
jgi:hypothetical protein